MNHLILWKDITLFWGTHFRAITDHKHPVIQQVISRAEAFSSRVVNGSWEPKQGLLIAPNYAHECDATGIPIFSANIDPDSAPGEWIQSHFLKQKKVVNYPSNYFPVFNLNQFGQFIALQDWKQAYTQILDFFGYPNTGNSPKKYDPRIQDVLDFIAHQPEQATNTKQLMNVAHLSESRLLHLFKSEIGLPIRNYIQWYRLQMALRHIQAGYNLTQAAYQAGFSDQAHFSRVSVKMLGIPPSSFIKHSKFIKVFVSD